MTVRKRRRIPWGWVWLLLPALAGGYYAWHRQVASGTPGELPKGLQIGVVERGDLERKINATGVVAAQTGAKVNVGSQISGRIRSLPADVGTRVARDQVIAILDAPDLEAQVEQQRRSVEVARAALAQAETRLAQSRLAAGLTESQTRAQIDEADSGVRAARARLDVSEAAAKMQPSQTEAEIARAQAALSTARSADRQVRQTVAQQVLQAQAAIDDARAACENLLRQRRRQESLLGEGFISRQQVDDTRTQHRQAMARLETAEAALRIVKEKNEADLQLARDQVLQAQAALAAAEAGREQDRMREAEARSARAAAGQAEALLELRRTYLTQDRISRQATQEAEGAVRQARAALRQADALLAFQRAQLDKAVIRSPIGGTVLSITAQQGETVAAGLAAPTLITVADLDRLEVRAYVDETDIGRVRNGLPAEVRVESFPERVFHGEVTKIAAASTVKDNVVTYETTVAIRDAGGRLRPDMTADVTLLLGRRPGVLLIPAEAVHREVKRTLVYVLRREKQGRERAELREVTVGFTDGVRTEVRSGLREKEEVILAGLPRLGVTAVDAQSTRPDRNRAR